MKSLRGFGPVRMKSLRRHGLAAIMLALVFGLLSRTSVLSATPKATLAPGAPQATPTASSAPPASRATFEPARAPYVFSFPADHAAHPAYQTEWWYFTGHLRTAQGRRFGFELTFFRFGLRPGEDRPKPGQSRWRGTQVFPAHFAVTDEQGHAFAYSERFVREALGMAGASSTTLALHAGDWTLRGEPMKDPRFERMHLHAADGDNALDLLQIPQKPPAIHGRDGVSRKAACDSCASHYYSYTRLRTSGTLLYAGTRYAVDGISWMDHEFGSSELQRDETGWDWFALQLDDGRELMLYLLRRSDGGVTPESSGSLIERDGSVHYLGLGDFSVGARANTHWHSPHTGASYPSLWTINVDSADLHLTVAPVMADQELAATNGGISYWEGAVDVEDIDGGGHHLGVGYVELTGYAGSVSL
jgi:predicted secreted hydrolase